MKDKGKITMVQAVLLFLIMIYSATMRSIPAYVIEVAGQAAWLTPAVALLFFFVLFIIIKRFVTKYPNQPLANIICNIIGKPLGKIIIIIYIFWFLILLALYVRYFDERLLSSIYPDVDIKILPIIILVLVGIMLRSGIVVIARMNKIIFSVVAIQFFLIILLMIQKIDLRHITPISHFDIIPIFKGSAGVFEIWLYFFFLFMISDKIIIKKNMEKNVLFSIIFIFILTTLLLIMLLGVFGAKTLLQIPLPLLTAVKYISAEYSGFESLFLSVWIFADFITISIFAYIIIRLLKSLFELQNPMPLLSILLIFIYFLSLFISNEVFELHYFAQKIGFIGNMALGFGVPVLIFVAGKMRKKL